MMVCRRPRRGIALVIALWMMAMLAVMLAAYMMSVRTESHIVSNYRDAAQARLLASAGVARAIQAIEQNLGPTFTGKEDWATLDSTTEDLGLQTGSYQVSILDESGRININEADEAMLTKLVGDTSVAEAILDWRDADDEQRPSGAESTYYGGLNPPYRAKNGPFDTTDELLLVAGVTPGLYYGATVTSGAAPPTTAATAAAAASGTTNTEQIPGLRDMVTVLSYDANLDVADNTRVNLKTANRQTLKEKLGDVLSDTQINAILTYRGDRTSSSGSGATSQSGGNRPGGGGTGGTTGTRPGGGSAGTGASGTGASGQPRSRQVATSGAGASGAPASGATSTSSSTNGTQSGGGQNGQPQGRFTSSGELLRVPGFDRSTVQQIADRVTVTDNKQLPGLVNINTASVPVLAALPGVDETIATEIVNAREGFQDGFQTIGDLLNIDAVTDDVWVALADHITVRSSAFRIVATGLVREGKLSQTIQCLVTLPLPTAPSSSGNRSGGAANDTNGGTAGTATPRKATIVYWLQ